MAGGWVYIMTNKPRGTLYVGVTADLARRAWEHREGRVKGFTKKYGLKHLVYAERHDDIRIAKTVIETGVEDRTVEPFLWQQLFRPDEPQLADIELRQCLIGGARNTRVLHIPDNGDAELIDVGSVLPNGHEVQQSLRRMRHVRLSGVQHGYMRIDMPRNVRGHARACVADDEHIDLHGLQRVDGVNDALALGA